MLHVGDQVEQWSIGHQACVGGDHDGGDRSSSQHDGGDHDGGIWWGRRCGDHGGGDYGGGHHGGATRSTTLMQGYLVGDGSCDHGPVLLSRWGWPVLLSRWGLQEVVLLGLRRTMLQS